MSLLHTVLATDSAFINHHEATQSYFWHRPSLSEKCHTLEQGLKGQNTLMWNKHMSACIHIPPGGASAVTWGAGKGGSGVFFHLCLYLLCQKVLLLPLHKLLLL